MCRCSVKIRLLDKVPVNEHVAAPEIDGFPRQSHHPFDRVVPVSVIEHHDIPPCEFPGQRLGKRNIVWMDIGQHAFSLHHHDGSRHSESEPEAESMNIPAHNHTGARMPTRLADGFHARLSSSSSKAFGRSRDPNTQECSPAIKAPRGGLGKRGDGAVAALNPDLSPCRARLSNAPDAILALWFEACAIRPWQGPG